MKHRSDVRSIASSLTIPQLLAKNPTACEINNIASVASTRVLALSLRHVSIPRALFWNSRSLLLLALKSPPRESGLTPAAFRAATASSAPKARVARQALLADRSPLLVRPEAGTPHRHARNRRPVAPRSPNLNAYAERWVRSVREECLDQIIVLGERHLRYVLQQYVEYFMKRRPCQGLKQQSSRSERGIPNDRTHPLSRGSGWADPRLLPRSGVSGRTRLVNVCSSESSRQTRGSLAEVLLPSCVLNPSRPDNPLRQIFQQEAPEVS